MIRKSFKPFLLFFLLFVPFSIWADQLIIEPDMGRGPIINAIRSTQHAINLVMYGFTDKELLDALIEQKMKGNTVSLILENHPFKAEDENKKVMTELNNHHIAWQGSIPPFRLIHQKTLIVDNQKAIVMTFNFTHSTFKNERNFALVIDEPQKVKQIAQLFSADWNHVPTHNLVADFILSPDDSRKKLLTHIMQARKSIAIYAQNVNDYKIVGALAKAAKNGVNVQLLTSAKMRAKQEAYLNRAGVNIRYSKAFIIHAKAVNIDNELAIIGSINLTRASLDDNRELSVITRDPLVIKQLDKTFQHDWTAASQESNKTIHNIKKMFPDERSLARTLRQIKKLVGLLTN